MEIEMSYGSKEITLRDKIKNMFCESDRMLLEATFDIQEDVGYIWKNILEPTIEYYKNNTKEIYNLCNYRKSKIINIISSTDLPSLLSKKASKNNPINIFGGILVEGNHYAPREKQLGLSLNMQAIMALGPLGLENLPTLQKIYPSIGEEFSKISLIGSAAHELSHWLDESIHNKNITRLLDKIKNKNRIISANDHTYLSYATIQEIDANIHAIESMKREIGQEEWDKLTFNDILSKKPSLEHAFNKLKTLDKKRYLEWKKRFFGRMAREGLIGKKMR